MQELNKKYTSVIVREAGGKVKMQGVEVVKVDEFKYLKSTIQSQRTVHGGGEVESADRIAWVEISVWSDV